MRQKKHCYSRGFLPSHFCWLYLSFLIRRIPLPPRLPKGRRPNGFLGLSLNDRAILFLVILLDKTVSVE